MKVVVVIPGTYLGADLKGVSGGKDDVIDIKAGPYSAKVIAWGCVRPLPPEETPAVEGEALPEAVQPEAVPAVPPEAADADPVGSLMRINGIGQRLAKKIVDSGIASLVAFAAADAVDLSEVAGTTVAKVQGWQTAAKSLLEE